MTFRKEDILDALGIEQEQTWFGPAMAGFGIGCLVGAALAMMFAPKAGRDLRHDIYERGRGMVDRGKEYMGRHHHETSGITTETIGNKPNPTY